MLLWWLLRACVVGDRAGLRWRGLGGWKSAAWDTVTDYYEALPTWAQQSNSTKVSTGTRPPFVVSVAETPRGKCGVTFLWSNAEALRDLVARKTVNCRTAGWELKGTRTCDPWPVVFDYDTRENRWAPRLWLKLFVVFVVYLVIKPALQFAATAHLIGWTVTLIVAGAYVVLVGSLGLIFLIPLAQYREANRRKAERITVDLGGIVFEDGARRLEAAWAEVTRYQIMPGWGLFSRIVVETRQGEFDFLSSLGNAALLQAIIQRYAVNADAREWRRSADEEALGGEAARWSDGKVGIGKRFFHYRTRGYRAILLGSAFLGVVAGLLFAGIGSGRLPGNAPPASAALAMGIGWSAGLLLGWRAYGRNGVAIDEIGLMQRTLFGDRYLSWEQVQEFVFSRTSGGTVVGRTQICALGLTLLAVRS